MPPERQLPRAGRAAAAAARTPACPAPTPPARHAPEWLIERGLDRNNTVAVHTGECWDPGKRAKPATRAQAIEALRHQVPACTKCRPDTALGIVD
ncbi:DUF6233 domain-containing protein [Streptomyces iakyrus]|uniref:DUF6233 domain-containing protein n=1 Tax=Streptomyces iakyrus TaxID=68219 RepID=UPI0036E413F1